MAIAYRTSLERKTEEQHILPKRHNDQNDYGSVGIVSCVKLCGQCEFLKKHAIAEYFCEDCDEGLCVVCCEQHKMMKVLQDHDLVKQTPRLLRKCGPCTYQNKNSESECYCKECEEELCLDCSKQHKALKLTRSHNLIDHSRHIVKCCAPCSYQNKQIEAKLHCRQCDEDLCTLCSEQHKALSFTRDHNLTDIATAEQTLVR